MNTIDITNMTDADLDSLLGMTDDNAVWEAVVAYEDGALTNAMIRALDDDDKAILADEMARIDAKNAKAMRTAIAAQPRSSLGRYCDNGHDYEGAILARQEREMHSELNY